jgi:DNA-binding GntR family transcriptional regulator
MQKNILSDQIRQEILDIIKTNRNIKDYKLPSERMLSIKFNASRPTVRVAYQKLIKQGYVECIHGKGYFIKNSDRSEGNSSMKLHLLFIAPSMKTAFMQQIYSGIMEF